MALRDKIYVGGSWVLTDILGANITGTPITSAVLDGTGEQIADNYTLTVSSRSGGTGTVTVGASANNPFNGRVVTGVNFDGTTPYTEIIPGTTLIFASAGANGNSATVKIGSPYGSFDASGVGAGVPTSGVKHQVLNDGASAVANAMARLLPQAIQVAITNDPLDSIGPFAIGATEKVAGGGSSRVMPYALTISGVSGSGPSKIATLSIDGTPFGSASLFDLTAGASCSGTGIKAISPGYLYSVITGPLTGLIFALSAGVANGDKANVLIFPSRYIQTAPDISGAEGTYGVADVDLTETGQATGVITASGVAYFWVRFLVPAAANNESNPYPCNIAIAASESTSAGWGS